MMIEFERAKTKADFERIALLAKEIWEEHYATILSLAQIRYMIENFQSTEAIEQQTKQGYEYFSILNGNALAGYFAIAKKDDTALVYKMGLEPNQSPKSIFLSKLYIQKNHRHQGIGKAVISHIKALANTSGIERIWLSVNKHNTNSLHAYKKLGFAIYREDRVSIGAGYVMDDYFMQLVWG
ncbi:GNAT family N-acetyltransferase [Helicobacter sp. 11S02596-1]|uniref:GNAT family N-acetyltransferase n=1 Tax=Helicobacter sp. 11S02596-1 TaxID=1476194 RepID=UPI000BA6964B|nr:GNAT family N-acetyltransferase [Helicobacter sp. 11S02596-1]PAF44196.1 hypothetical protein BJI48_03165 [Helicobacter sp. 11S02596-1]